MSIAEVKPAPPTIQTTGTHAYNYALGYMKAAIIALVVAHHSVLAYHPDAPQPPASLLAFPRIWQAFPVVDSQRGTWAALFATFNDIYFMALMFFVSGLFVWRSLVRKGSGAYMRDRLVRIGLPFIPAALILAPLSYYPTYLQTAHHGGFTDYLGVWASLGSWSAGPAWFLWVLMVFDQLAVLLYVAAPRWGESLGRLTAGALRRPGLFFAALVAAGGVAYSVLTLRFGPFYWVAWGPFTFQTNRILLYLVYFVGGIGVGAQDLERGLLSPQGRLAACWPLWVSLAPVAFIAYLFAALMVFSHPLPATWQAAVASGPVMASLGLFALSCAASGFALMALFVRFANSRMRLFESLSKNAYGIFLVHFVFVSWCGYALVGAPLPGIVKFVLVFFAALALSLGTTILLRRIPWATRVL